MKVWKPGCLVCEDDDEYYEPLDREGKKLATQTKLIINLAKHRAKLIEANNRLADTKPE